MRIARIFLIILIFALLTLFLSNSAQAMDSPNYQLNWFVPLSGGGGESQSANYTIHLTYGQTFVGTGVSSSYRANLGYWFGVLRDWWTHIHLPIVFR